MGVDNRIELRIATTDKVALSRRAAIEGITLSTLLRRGIRSVLEMPPQLKGNEANEVVALRRRVNALAAKLDDLGSTDPELSSLRRGLCQAHVDARGLLGRDRCL